MFLSIGQLRQTFPYRLLSKIDGELTMDKIEGWEPHPTRKNIYKHKNSGLLYRRMKSGWFRKLPQKSIKEYDPIQLEILMEKLAFTLGSNLEGLLFQQKNILDNQLNNLMIDHNGQADSITPDEIIGAYEIATIHNGHPSYFLCGWEGKD